MNASPEHPQSGVVYLRLGTSSVAARQSYACKIEDQISPSPILSEVSGEASTHLIRYNTLIMQILPQSLHNLKLLLDCQSCDCGLNHTAHASRVHGDETMVIHKDEQAHRKLAVHAIRDAAMAGNGLAEVLDLEGALEAGGEEATEGSNQ